MPHSRVPQALVFPSTFKVAGIHTPISMTNFAKGMPIFVQFFGALTHLSIWISIG
jgi:hypothetical protein